ncbi:MAG: hypothetical protein R3190_17480, partial [Thermoanaerobaculia bacterium]|nr:hypothetical protein [Thermoanaerobaculia bacterium]
DVLDGAGSPATRFLVPFVPLVFVMLNGLLNLVAAKRRWTSTSLRRVALVAAVVAVLVCNGLWGHGDAGERWKDLLVLKRPYGVPAARRQLVEMTEIESFTRDDPLVAVVRAGVPAFFFPHLRLIDSLGYNDRYLARIDAVPGFGLDNAEGWIPGHVKWDYDYVLGMQPDVVQEVWYRVGTVNERRRLMDAWDYAPYGRMWVWRRSTKIVMPE